MTILRNRPLVIRTFQTLLNDWQIKLLMLVIASALWFYVRRSQVSEVPISIPIQYINKPPRLVFLREPRRFAEIRVRGRESDLKFSTFAFRAEADLSGATTGAQDIRLSFDRRQLPDSVELAEGSVYTKVLLDELAVRRIPLVADVRGNPLPGLVAGVPVLIPDSIIIEGPRSLMPEVRAVVLAAVHTDGAGGNIKVRRRVLIPPEFSTQTPDVEVYIPLARSESRKILSDIPVSWKGEGSAGLKDLSVRVEIQGTIAGVQSVSSRDLEVTAEPGRFISQGPGEGILIPLKVSLRGDVAPSEVVVTKTEPAFAELKNYDPAGR